LSSYSYIMCYAWRTGGSGRWNFASEGFTGTFIEWFRMQQEYKNQETKLLNAIPCTAEEAKWVSENT
jgi:hypothetical protein